MRKKRRKWKSAKRNLSAAGLFVAILAGMIIAVAVTGKENRNRSAPGGGAASSIQS